MESRKEEIQKTREKAEELMRKELDSDVVESIDKLKRIKEYENKTGSDTTIKIKHKLSKLLFVMLPRKRDSVKEKGTYTTTEEGITFRDGGIYEYNKKKNKTVALSKIIRFKSDIIDLYREDEKRKLVSELINLAEEYLEAGKYSPLWIKDIEDESIYMLSIKFGETKEITISFNVNKSNICFDYTEPSFFLKKRNTERFHYLERVKEELNTGVEKIINGFENKIEKKNEIWEKIEEKGSPYLVQEAL